MTGLVSDTLLSVLQVQRSLPHASALEPGSAEVDPLPGVVQRADRALAPLCTSSTYCLVSTFSDSVHEQVPLRQDYSDLYNLLAFFDGGVSLLLF